MIRIGLDVGGTSLKLGVVDDQARIVHRAVRPSVHNCQGLAIEIAQMIQDTRKLFPGAPFGVSCPGDFDDDGMLSANQLCIEHEPLKQTVVGLLGEEIPWENDGVCAVLAELDSGSLKGCESALMITIGTGIGGGAVVNGKVCRGYHGTHAELGHMITHVHGERCSCGRTGCWECYAAASALSKMAGGMPVREIVDHVQQGLMLDIWNRWLTELAQGLIGLSSIFNPEKIAIGGGISNADDLLLNDLQKTLMADQGYANYHAFVKLVTAKYKNDAGILGAAALVNSDKN